MKNKTSFFSLFLFCLVGRVEAFQIPINYNDVNFSFNKMPEVMPGTRLLTWEGDLSAKMLDGAHKFIEGRIKESIGNRSKLWNRDLTSTEAYELSVEPNRKRFMKYIGVEDKTEPLVNYNAGIADKHPQVVMQKFSVNNDPELIAETENTGFTRFDGRY